MMRDLTSICDEINQMTAPIVIVGIDEASREQQG
jgi:hypothetical protein